MRKRHGRNKRRGGNATLTSNRIISVVCAGVLVLAFQFFTAVSDLDAQGEMALKTEIYYEYLRYQQAHQGEEQAMFFKPEDIQFSTLSVRGDRSEAVARVVITPHPAQPPGSEQLRYYRMQHSMLGGWTVKNEAKSLSYYTKLF